MVDDFFVGALFDDGAFFEDDVPFEAAFLDAAFLDDALPVEAAELFFEATLAPAAGRLLDDDDVDGREDLVELDPPDRDGLSGEEFAEDARRRRGADRDDEEEAMLRDYSGGLTRWRHSETR